MSKPLSEKLNLHLGYTEVLYQGGLHYDALQPP